MSELNDIDRIVNRHMARLLTDLEDAGCPVVFRETVKARLSWMRSDLKEMRDEERLPLLPVSR
jgi:hypothetical protein